MDGADRRPGVTRKSLGPLVAVIVLMASACGEALAGQPVAATKHLPAPTSQPSTPASDREAAEQRLEELDPCTLLPEEFVRQFGARNGERDDVAGIRVCVWTIPDGNGLFSVSLVPDKGLDEVVVGQGEVSQRQVGSYPAKLVKEIATRGECMLAIAVTATSRIDVDSLYKVDTATACERVIKVAERAVSKFLGDR